MSYRKGAAAERELLKFLNKRGFAVIRAPSSGGFFTSVDIVAMKKGNIVGIESKAYSKKPRISRDQLRNMREWCDKAGAIGIIGWRSTGKWLFLPLESAEAGRYEDENWIEMQIFFNIIDGR